MKIAVFRARLYEQPGGTCAAGPSFTILKPSTSKPDDWAASLAAAKHSLAAGGCWPAGHPLALRVQPGGVRGTPSVVPLKAAEARGAGTSSANATAWLARGSAIWPSRERARGCQTESSFVAWPPYHVQASYGGSVCHCPRDRAGGCRGARMAATLVFARGVCGRSVGVGGRPRSRFRFLQMQHVEKDHGPRRGARATRRCVCAWQLKARRAHRCRSSTRDTTVIHPPRRAGSHRPSTRRRAGRGG